MGVRFVSPGDGAPYGAMVFVGGGRTVADRCHKGSGFASLLDSATSGGNRQRARLRQGATGGPMALARIDGGQGRRNRTGFVSDLEKPIASTIDRGFSRPKTPVMEAAWGQGASVGSTDVGEDGSSGL